MRQYRRRRKKQPLEFVYLLNALLKNPPIRHRGEPPDSGLSVFEFVIAATLTLLARQHVPAARHIAGLSAGKAALAKARKSRKLKYRVEHGDADFKSIGSNGYREGVAAFNATNVFEIVVEISGSGLLKAAGLTRSARNAGLLTGALARLTQGLRIGHREFPPLLRSARRLSDGRLRAVVDGIWVPLKMFDLVPWPLPTRGGGATTLALYLFLFGLDYRPERQTLIRVDNLYRRLRMEVDRHAARALNAALDQVNAHLRKLGAPTHFAIRRLREGTYLRISKSERTVPSTGAPKGEPVFGRAAAELREARRRAADEIEAASGERSISQKQEARRARGYHKLAPDEQLNDELMASYRRGAHCAEARDADIRAEAAEADYQQRLAAVLAKIKAMGS